MIQSRSKSCFKCGEEKPISEFYKHAQMGDGHLNKCKACTKRDATRHRNEHVDEVRAYDRERAKLPHRRKLNVETCRRFRNTHPERYAAQMRVGNALRGGFLVRPKICSDCGTSCKPEAHHWSYKKEHALDVEWLCPVCHSSRHHKAQKEMLF